MISRAAKSNGTDQPAHHKNAAETKIKGTASLRRFKQVHTIYVSMQTAGGSKEYKQSKFHSENEIKKVFRQTASSHLLWLYRPVYVGPGRKPRRLVFSIIIGIIEKKGRIKLDKL